MSQQRIAIVLIVLSIDVDRRFGRPERTVIRPPRTRSTLTATLGVGVLFVLAGCGAATAHQVGARSWELDDAALAASDTVWRSVRVGAAAAQLPDAEIDIRMALLEELLSANEYDAALAHAEVLRRARPGWHSFRYQEARALLFGRADLSGAVSAADACLAVRPDHAGCLEIRGRALADGGATEDAIESLRAALLLEPGRTDAAETLARLLMYSGQHEAALAVLDEVIRGRGRTLNLALLRATILERAGSTDDAEAEFRRVAQLHPDAGSGLRYLAAFYRRQDRLDDSARTEAQAATIRR